MRMMSLAAIIKANPTYENFNFLKIDTDGYDFEVLEGAKEYIKRNLPTILFECDFSHNVRYVEDFVEAMTFFKEAGYSSILVYVNVGYLFGKFALVDMSNIKYMLLYHLTSRFGYFDVLVMREENMHSFVESEISYFINSIPNETVQRTARAAAAL
jgi:Methyltransferase FkbM domain